MIKELYYSSTTARSATSCTCGWRDVRPDGEAYISAFPLGLAQSYFVKDLACSKHLAKRQQLARLLSSFIQYDFRITSSPSS